MMEIIEYIDGKIKYKNGGFKKKFVKLKCVCDKEIVVRITEAKNYKSCGCLKGNNLKINNNKNLPKGEASFRRVYKTYKDNARKKNKGFNILIEDFRLLTQKPCYYCGELKSNNANYSKNGGYSYNGLDRVDNSKGYFIENVVPCCKNCNRAKATLTQKEFLNLVKKIYDYTRTT